MSPIMVPFCDSSAQPILSGSQKCESSEVMEGMPLPVASETSPDLDLGVLCPCCCERATWPLSFECHVSVVETPTVENPKLGLCSEAGCLPELYVVGDILGHKAKESNVSPCI